ncbi:MAG: hypothetical protein ACT4NT_00530 [Nitrososphaerota archaeon]
MSKIENNIKNSIDVRVLGIIVALAIAYQVGSFYVDKNAFSITDILYLSGILSCAILSIFVAKRYRGSEVFGKAYFFLGIGFISWFIGEVLYYYYLFVMKINPWPSPSDVFFIGSYVFATLHLVLNTRYFKRSWNILMKVWITVIPISITVIYILVAAQEWGTYTDLPFDLFYSGIFAGGVSAELAFAVIGLSVFRHSVLGTVWLLLVVGIFLWAVADIWFVYSEIFFEEGEYLSPSHPINTLWILTFMLVTYALFRHRKMV